MATEAQLLDNSHDVNRPRTSDKLTERLGDG